MLADRFEWPAFFPQELEEIHVRIRDSPAVDCYPSKIVAFEEKDERPPAGNGYCKRKIAVFLGKSVYFGQRFPGCRQAGCFLRHDVLPLYAALQPFPSPPLVENRVYLIHFSGKPDGVQHLAHMQHLPQERLVAFHALKDSYFSFRPRAFLQAAKIIQRLEANVVFPPPSP